MTVGEALVVFVGSLIVSTISSIVLANSLEKIGTRLQLSEALLGIVTALAADSPEISSAIAALIANHHDLGLGVVIGSNIFNLVALLGLSAIVAGRVTIKQPVLLFNGMVGLIVTAVMVALVFKLITPGISVVLILVLLVPYILISSLQAQQVDRWQIPAALKQLLYSLVEDVHQSARKDKTPPYATWNDILAVVPALVSIVVASFGMVNAVVVIGEAWNIPHIILGILILSTLTGIPNVLAAIQLAQHKRGSAVVSETLNSNTLNVLSGVSIPALILGLNAVAAPTLFAVWWLLGMTGLVLWLTYRGHGLFRQEGKWIVTLYLVFVGIIILWA